LILPFLTFKPRRGQCQEGVILRLGLPPKNDSNIGKVGCRLTKRVGRLYW